MIMCFVILELLYPLVHVSHGFAHGFIEAFFTILASSPDHVYNAPI